MNLLEKALTTPRLYVHPSEWINFFGEETEPASKDSSDIAGRQNPIDKKKSFIL